jgi:hypothetical protein
MGYTTPYTISAWAKRPDREAEHSPSSSFEVNIDEAIPPNICFCKSLFISNLYQYIQQMKYRNEKKKEISQL